jgi:hypothetical protein
VTLEVADLASLDVLELPAARAASRNARMLLRIPRVEQFEVCLLDDVERAVGQQAQRLIHLQRGRHLWVGHLRSPPCV